MKSKQIDDWGEEKPKKPKSIRAIKKAIKELELDLEAIIEEHKKYTFPTPSEAGNWINSLPINTLKDSISYEKGSFSSFFSIRNMHHRPALAKLFDKKIDEYEQLKSDLQVKQIDATLKKIKDIETKHV